MPKCFVVAVLSILIGSFAAVGCGDDAPPEPDISELAVECVDSSRSGVDGQILETVSVRVTDADRDLVGVEGTINGLQITLTDDDADERFAWSPPEGVEPMVCDGEFVVSLTASDAAGHESGLYQIVEK